MSDQLDFETALERRLQARAAAGSRPFDASAIARAAIAARPPRRLGLTAWTGRRAWALAFAGLLLALLAGAVVAGALLQHREPWLAVARADGIYLAHRDGSLVRRLADTGTYTRLSWSSDGALLLVQQDFHLQGDNAALGVARMTAFRPDGSVAWTTDHSIGEAGDATWSHRGHRLAWLDDWGNDLAIADLDTGSSTRRTDLRISFVLAPEWSPDDTRIVVIGHREALGSTALQALLVVPLDGGDPVVLTPYEYRGLSHPAWSPDGRSIAALCWEVPYCPEPQTIEIFDAATGERIDGTTAGGYPVAWSPDGTRLAWSREAADGNVMVDTLPLSDGGATAVLPGPGWQDLAGWTPDGALLVLKPNASTASGSSDQAWRPDLWQVEADGSHPVLLARGVTAAALQPTP